MGLALLVWVGGGLLKRVLYFFILSKISDPAPASRYMVSGRGVTLARHCTTVTQMGRR